MAVARTRKIPGSKPNTTWILRYNANGQPISCSCPQYFYRKVDGDCKHMLAERWRLMFAFVENLYTLAAPARADMIPARPMDNTGPILYRTP